MIRVIIIEDEPPAQQRLIVALHELDLEIDIVATPTSVAETLAWLDRHEPPDLAFADIALADGLSLEIFETASPRFPVVFCTAYDGYMLEAFQRNGIAYLLKPYETEQLADAVHKYTQLRAHFDRHVDDMPQRLAGLARDLASPRGPRRLLARDKERFVAIALEDIAYLELRDATTQLVCSDGRRFVVERSLSELETELTPSDFFRINRQVLAKASAVAGFRPYFKGRLLVELRPKAEDDVVVSQPNTAKFRAWLAG